MADPLAGHPRYVKLRSLNEVGEKGGEAGVGGAGAGARAPGRRGALGRPIRPSHGRAINRAPGAGAAGPGAAPPGASRRARRRRGRTLPLPSQGTFGFVELALDKATDTQVAVKFLERGPGVTRSTLREVLNHRLCVAHPHIVRFQEALLTPRHLAIVMEYAPGGDMFEFVLAHRERGGGGGSSAGAPRGLPEPVARAFFQQLVVALQFAHELGVANRDIKLENMLLGAAPAGGGLPPLKVGGGARGRRRRCRPPVPPPTPLPPPFAPQICDFGYSKNEYIDSRPKSVSGTPGEGDGGASGRRGPGRRPIPHTNTPTHPTPSSSPPQTTSRRKCSSTTRMTAAAPTSGRPASSCTSC